jgi:Mrp family chromosome partitioning ATPase
MSMPSLSPDQPGFESTGPVPTPAVGPVGGDVGRLLPENETSEAAPKPRRKRTSRAAASDGGELLRSCCEAILHGLQSVKLESGDPPRTVGVTSCYAGEGVTTVAYHLALAAAADGKRVLLADVDFADPSLEQFIKASPGPGLAEVLSDERPIAETVRRFPDRGVTVLTAGQVDMARQAAYARRMGELVEFAAEQFDFSVLDLPSLNVPGGPAAVSASLDGLLLVVAAQRVRWPVAHRFVTSLQRSGGNPLGVVLNKQRRHIPDWLYRTL